MTGFTPVKFSFGQIHLTGEHAGEPTPVISKVVSDPSGKKTGHL